MKPELILQADILDIIFEDRNKEYGAYNLRKDYNGRMMKSMSGVVLLVTGIFVINYFNDTDNKSNPFITGPISDTVTLLPPSALEPPPPIEPPKQQVATIRNPTFVLSNEAITDTLPTIE